MPLRLIDPFRDPTATLVKGLNPYVDLLIDAQNSGSLPIIYGPTLRSTVGLWRERFKSGTGQPHPPEKLILEIGSHRGDVIAEMAWRHPATAFVGMDITFKRVVTTAQRAKKRELNNIISILANGAHVDALFQAGELDGVVVFFPDPWTAKKNQAKNRLFNPTFCQSLQQVLAPGGFVWLKTDSPLYFDNASEFLEQSGFVRELPGEGLPAERYTSGFERIFEQKGTPVHRGVWLKKPQQIISFYN